MKLQLRQMLACAALLASLAACGPPPPSTEYSPQTELNFRRACQAGGSSMARCGCIWGKIAAEIPPADFDALEALPEPERNAHPLMLQIQGYATTCAAQQ